MVRSQQEALDLLIKSGRCSPEELAEFSDDGLAVLAQSTIEYLETGESLTIQAITKADYEFEVPTVDRIIEDPYYLGNDLGYPRDADGNLITGEKRQMYDYWVNALHRVYEEPCTEVLVTGAIGGGKTTFTNTIEAIDFIHLLALKNPQRHFGLMPSTNIVFAFFNVLKDLAQDVGYAQFQAMLENSPFFREKLIRNPRKREGFRMEPPKSKRLVFKVGSRISHTLGIAVFGAQVDEANFGTDIAEKASDEKRSQVYDNYTSLLRRKKSRFLHAPGHFCIVSSKRTEADFLEKHIEQQKGKEGVFVIDEPIYVFKKCRGEYNAKTFRVLLGDLTRDPRMLKEGEQVDEQLQDKIIEVPVDFEEDFQKNIIDSLRDIAGVSAQPKAAFFTNRDLVRTAFDEHRKAPWAYSAKKGIPNTVYLSFHGSDQLGDFLKKDLLFCDNGKLPYAQSARFVAIDTGVTGDASGISVGCRAGVASFKKTDSSGKERLIYVPKFHTDCYIRIKGQDEKGLPLYKLEEFVKYLVRDLQISVKGTATDGYQATQLRQNLLIAFPSMIVELHSVDEDDLAHLALRNVVYEHRVEGMYIDQNLLVELFDLQHIYKTSRAAHNRSQTRIVDHPRKASDGFAGRKDVSDSLANMISLCQMYDATATTIEETQQRLEELKGVDIDKLVKDAELQADAALKDLDKLDLDKLFK